MRALVIGGTRFIGRHLVKKLLEAGHEVTLFHRGQHPGPPGVKTVHGDRTRSLAPVAGRDWDAVFDTCLYFPREMDAAISAFAGCGSYVYVSSGSAYAESPVPVREDETPLEPCSDEEATDETGRSYGARKAECDRRLLAAARERGFPGRVARLSLVVGPCDYTERLDYWIHRVATQDRVPVPMPDTLFHLSFAPDVARALILLAEAGEPGTAYNVADDEVFTTSESLAAIARACGRDGKVAWRPAPAADLEAAGLGARDYPAVAPGHWVMETARLRGLGFRSTPFSEAIEQTVKESLASGRTGAGKGPDPAREAALWR